MNRYILLKERGTIVPIFLRPARTEQTLRHIAARLEEYGTTRDAARYRQPRRSRYAENIEAVAEDVVDHHARATYTQAILNLVNHEKFSSKIVMNNEARFNRSRLLFIRLLEVTSLCRQASDSRSPKRE